jgi:predicted TIM-barrel fold metal-dependent hydrolase
MFGSDWPVSLLRSSHAGWTRVCADLTDNLDAAAQAAFWGGNAARIYQIPN